MNFIPQEIYHIYNRGNNRQVIFFHEDNYLYFLKKMRTELLVFCDILAYCLMPNHFHFLIVPNEIGCNINDSNSGQTTLSRPTTQLTTQSRPTTGLAIQPLTRKIAILQSSYTRAIQKQQLITGSLFQQKTKALQVSALKRESYNTNYPLTCFHYIHQNPLKAKLVDKMEDWQYSSFQDYVGFRNGTLCNKALAYELLGIPKDRDELLSESYGVIPNDTIDKIH